MRSRGKEHLRDADHENGAVNKPDGAAVPDGTPPTSDPPTPILQSDDEELLDEDSPK
ncbi:hypothetical protein [Paraburkholderia sp. BL10I2N1]|uniref:hypothetical protein n=1 Tax=Paraburkholderia sp. BL10I2N1 TaxID=1938796 RepID=UPI0010EA8793|nr:hypothetical protein [Paraburkholderia sp. BL10I2N1]TDN68836.1 hypothetical protein B0G77_2188 [Paraburkholderia sp. BL10I2N1]